MGHSVQGIYSQITSIVFSCVSSRSFIQFVIVFPLADLHIGSRQRFNRKQSVDRLLRDRSRGNGAGTGPLAGHVAEPAEGSGALAHATLRRPGTHAQKPKSRRLCAFRNAARSRRKCTFKTKQKPSRALRRNQRRHKKELTNLPSKVKLLLMYAFFELRVMLTLIREYPFVQGGSEL